MKARRNIAQGILLACIVFFCNQVQAHAKSGVAAVEKNNPECAFSAATHLQSEPALHQVLYTVEARTSFAKSTVNKLTGITAAVFIYCDLKEAFCKAGTLFTKAYISHIHPTHTFW